MRSIFQLNLFVLNCGKSSRELSKQKDNSCFDFKNLFVYFFNYCEYLTGK